jgi:hypothetical protein
MSVIFAEISLLNDTTESHISTLQCAVSQIDSQLKNAAGSQILPLEIK